MKPFGFVWFATKPHLRIAGVAILCVIAASAATSSIPYIYKLLTDSLLASGTAGFEPVFVTIGIYFGISLFAHFAYRASGIIGGVWATGGRATARATLTAHLTRHSYQYFSDRFSGSMLSKVKQGADGAKDFAEGFMWQALLFIIPAVVSMTIAFLTSPVVGLILIALFLVIVPFNLYFAKRRVPLSIAAQDAETVVNGATVDALSNITSVHEHANRSFEMERLKSLLLRRRELSLRNWRYSEWVLFWNGLFVNAFMGAMVMFSAYLAMQGVLTPGDVILFIATVWLLEEKFLFLGSQINHFTEVWGQLSESLADIAKPHDMPDQEGAKDIARLEGAMLLDSVTFSYSGVSVFKDLTLALAPGEKIGIVGKSGAGKSTLIKLILRHYDVEEGTIRIDGTDIREVTKESLRRAIAIVPQEPSLFHRTIRENIAYARPDASMDDVVRAARQAQADEFIRALPQGYESLVGERGVKLSGGQRQRVAIARAILKDAPILLLDEATSALDSESEVEVQKALLELMKGRTVIAIAHRLSTLRAMDRLIVFDKGSIVEDGTHDELLRTHGIYSELWNHQAGGFITDESEK
ncbi:MAG: ABC transporter ATP-binding protein [Hyphomicrobium sp.]